MKQEERMLKKFKFCLISFAFCVNLLFTLNQLPRGYEFDFDTFLKMKKVICLLI